MNEGIQQRLEVWRQAPEKLLEEAKQKVWAGYETVRGSGNVMQEWDNLKKAALGLPSTAVGGAFEASKELLTLQPWEATKTAAHTLGELSKDMAKVFVAPVATGIAATKQTLNGIGKVVSLPLKVPVEGFRKVENGLKRAATWAKDSVKTSKVIPLQPTVAPSPALSASQKPVAEEGATPIKEEPPKTMPAAA